MKRAPTPTEQEHLARRPHFTELESRQVALCVEALSDLGTERQFGMACGPIPMSAVRAWAKDAGFDRDATMILRDVIFMLERDRIDREESARRLKGKS